MMTVTVINDWLNIVQVFNGSRHYTCQTKMIDGVLCFWFKGAWHVVDKYINEYTTRPKLNI